MVNQAVALIYQSVIGFGGRKLSAMGNWGLVVDKKGQNLIQNTPS
jgi:hypothetical protein